MNTYINTIFRSLYYDRTFLPESFWSATNLQIKHYIINWNKQTIHDISGLAKSSASMPGTTTLMCRATSNCLGKARRATESL